MKITKKVLLRLSMITAVLVATFYTGRISRGIDKVVLLNDEQLKRANARYSIGVENMRSIILAAEQGDRDAIMHIAGLDLVANLGCLIDLNKYYYLELPSQKERILKTQEFIKQRELKFSDISQGLPVTDWLNYIPKTNVQTNQ